MASNGGTTFVEWKEDFVSQERGHRIVHYILKDSFGKYVLAVVGTERSLRHMVYVVADDFLSYSGTDNPIQAGFKWRSRREVVDWLTSMLAKQHQSDSPRGDATESLGSSDLLSPQHLSFAEKMDRRVRNLRQSYSDIVWLGAAWTCGKQLKHYPAFCSNGTTIAVQSYVFVMAKEENRYVAYLEDMYEDRKGQKKVKVRWFHHSQEVKGVVRLRNAHPKEVYITPYTQVISVECVDGPAIVLTRQHFDKCVQRFPDDLLGKVHLCFRQFRSNKIKPFELSKMKGYFDQPIISCLESNTFPNSDSIYHAIAGNGVRLFRSGENLGKGTKRARNSADQESFHTDAKGSKRKKTMRAPFCKNGKSDLFDRRLNLFKNVECQHWHARHFKVDDRIELLCQDSGIRGCWFRCTVLEISRKQMKVQYSDLEDQDGCGNLEEWVPAFRLAAEDKLGMRCLGRPTIRPCPPISDSTDAQFQVGASVDAWWSDGWWEGVVTAINNGGADDLQVYIPGENMFINVPQKDLRTSRDWVDGNWVDVNPKLDILSIIGSETKVPVVSTGEKNDRANDFVPQVEVHRNENTDADLLAPAASDGHLDQASSPDKIDEINDGHVYNKSDNVTTQDMSCDAVFHADGDGQNIGNDGNCGESEGKSGSDDIQSTKTASQDDMHSTATATQDDVLSTETATQDNMHVLVTTAQDDLHNTETAVQDDMHGTETAAQNVMHCTETAVQNVMHSTETAALNVMNSTETAAQYVMHSTETAAGDDLHNTETAAWDDLHMTETAAQDDLHITETAVQDAVLITEVAARDAMHITETAAHDDLHITETAVQDDMHITEIAARDAMRITETAAQDDMHITETAAQDDMHITEAAAQNDEAVELKDAAA